MAMERNVSLAELVEASYRRVGHQKANSVCGNKGLGYLRTFETPDGNASFVTPSPVKRSVRLRGFRVSDVRSKDVSRLTLQSKDATTPRTKKIATPIRGKSRTLLSRDRHLLEEATNHPAQNNAERGQSTRGTPDTA